MNTLTTDSIAHPDPLIRWRRRQLVTVSCGVLAFVLLGGWALWSTESQDPDALGEFHYEHDRGAEHAQTDGGAALNPLDLEAFQAAALWNPPRKERPEPVPLKAERSRPRPILILIALIDEADGETRAALFHQNHNALVTVGVGDSIDPFIVHTIEADHIELRDGDFSLILNMIRNTTS